MQDTDFNNNISNEADENFAKLFSKLDDDAKLQLRNLFSKIDNILNESLVPTSELSNLSRFSDVELFNEF